MKTFIMQKCKTAQFNLMTIRQIRKYLARANLETLVNRSLLIFHIIIDYVNGILANLPAVFVHPCKIYN